jgi:GNAT superfamily N-acetyltransferase
VKETVTYVEMTALSQLIPAAPVPGLTLEPVDRGSPFIPGILARIGAPHGWKSASRTEREWAAWFAAYPEFVGKGLGGFALTLGVQQAWALAPSVNRVWLDASSLDHPRALPNYHRRGFRTFKTEQEERG